MWNFRLQAGERTLVASGRLRALDSGSGYRPNMRMKNIQVIDGALNAVYDIFAATDEEFALIFPDGQNVAFIGEVQARGNKKELDEAFARIWRRRILKCDVRGIHGTLFCELDHKKQYYPTRRDEEARNPDGTHLRRSAGA